MTSLFVLSSLEAWPTIMYHMIDGAEIAEVTKSNPYKPLSEIGPKENNNLP